MATARGLHAVGEERRAGEVIIIGSLAPHQIVTRGIHVAQLNFRGWEAPRQGLRLIDPAVEQDGAYRRSIATCIMFARSRSMAQPEPGRSG